MADSLGLLGQQPSAGLLGTSRWDSVWPMLMSLGAGIASGGAPGGGGWGGGIGRGLSLATNAVQQQRENQLQNALLQLKLREAGRPEIKDITLPGGGKISASVSPGGTVSPLDTSGLGPQATVPDFENTQKLRKEYQATPQYQTWAQAQPIWQSMKDASKRPTRAADLTLSMASQRSSTRTLWFVRAR